MAATMKKGSYPTGMRAFAVRNIDKEAGVAYVFGCGVYVGDKLRPGATLIDEKTVDKGLVQTCLERIVAWEQPEALAQMTAKNIEFMRDQGKTQEEIDAWLEKTAKIREEPAESRALRHAIEAMNSVAYNPRVDLDNGNTVWGFECWWGPEDRLPEVIAGLRVVEVEPTYNEKGPEA